MDQLSLLAAHAPKGAFMMAKAPEAFKESFSLVTLCQLALG